MRDLQFSFGFSLLFLAAFEVKKVLIADEEFFFFSSSVRRNKQITKLTKLDFYSIENSRIIAGRVCNFKKSSYNSLCQKKKE